MVSTSSRAFASIPARSPDADRSRRHSGSHPRTRNGCNDLPKPFDPAELVARIRAILRRAAPAQSVAVLKTGDIELDSGTRVARRDALPVDLTTVEFDLLAVLMRDSGTVVSRSDLVQKVLGREFSPFDRSIDTHVCNLRRKLGPLGDGAGADQERARHGLSLRSFRALVKRLFTTIFLWFFLTLLGVTLLLALVMAHFAEAWARC